MAAPSLDTREIIFNYMRLRRRFGRICRTCKLLPPPRPLPPTRTPPATRAWPCCRRSRPGAAAPHPHTSTGRNSRARDRAEETRPRTKSTARGVAALRPRRPRARLRCIGVLRAPSPAPAHLRGDALLWSDRRFPPLPASLDALLFYLHRVRQDPNHHKIQRGKAEDHHTNRKGILNPIY